MEYLFSYGTLQLPAVQRDVFGADVAGQADALVGFRCDMIEITDPDVLALSGERFHPVVSRTNDPQDRVPGMVFSLSPAQLARADAYEVDDYVRERVTLASGLSAWLYVARNAS
ncbi:MAG: gamma-glutamylcyclotransferase family protein [Pseudomonadota bacterium]